MDTASVRKFIHKHNINAEIIEHKSSGLTSKDASEVHGVDLSCIIKTILFVSKNEIVIVICRGCDRVNMKKLEAFGVKKPRMARREELKEVLNTEPGRVPPIALPDNIRKFVDKKVMGSTLVIGSAGSEFAGLKINPKDILKYSNAEVVDIVE